MSQVSILVELAPVGLALVSTGVTSRKLQTTMSKYERITLWMVLLANTLLVIAQLSWWQTFAINHDLQDTVWVNVMWTIFNSLVMLIFIRQAGTGDYSPPPRRSVMTSTTTMQKAEPRE